MTYAEKIAREIIEKQTTGRTLLREDIASAIQNAMDKQATVCMKAGVFFAKKEFGLKGNEDKIIQLQDKIHYAEVKD